MAEIRLSLTELENPETGRSGTVSWIVEGINLEDAQDGLRLDIRRLPHDATATQRTALQEKRQKLAARIAKFHENADAMTGGLELDAGTVHIDDPRFCRAEGELDEGFEVQHADDDDFGWVDDEIPAEDMGLWMPSSVPSDRAAFFGLAALRAEELELRKGQANDCLEKL
ncbi:hypothetical protein AZE42_13878, partial [Rhizopogon vesiculosus]